jgi:hypothetical protein
MKRAPLSAFALFSESVRNSKLSDALKNAPVVAVLHGPCEVIEAVVQRASRDSGVAMDWGYSGGRAFVHSNRKREEARAALAAAMPGGDIGQGDL